jgi:hypothetical protein
MVKKWHFGVFLIFLGGLLFAYWLPNRFYLFEPYPALLFPSGHGKFITPESGIIQVKKTVIYGIKKGSNKKIEIPLEEFLYPIPPHIALHIVRNEFGLNPKPIKVILGEINTIFWIQPKGNKKKVEEAKNWLMIRLEEKGCSNNYFILAHVQLEYNTKTRKLLNEKLISSNEIILLENGENQ